MKYNPDLELTIATYADGGIVASMVSPDEKSDTRYSYMCAFENGECARKFVEENLHDQVFFKTKTLATIAREFNCGIVYPGMAGIAYVNNENMVEHIDTDELIKKMYNHIAEPKKSYGYPLIVNNEIAKIDDVDFNKNYFILLNTNGHLMHSSTYGKDNKKKDWLIVATNKKLLQSKADGFGISEENREIVKDTLSGLLMCFLPKSEFDGVFAGIEYVDTNGSQLIPKRKIRKILDDRQRVIGDIYKKSEIYLDARYFVSADKKYGAPTIYTRGNVEYIVVSQRMDIMLKAFKLEGINTNNLLFTNILTLREIIEGCANGDTDGIMLFLDDNPDHAIQLSANDVYASGLDGDGDPENMPLITNNNEFMMAERYTIMVGGGYVINSIESPETGEIIDVIVLADGEATLMNCLEETGFVFANEKATTRQTYEIFAEFREGELEDCDGIMYFDGDGFYLMPKETIIQNLEKWEAETGQKSTRVDLDFDEYHFVALDKYGPIVYTNDNGVEFVVVAKGLRWMRMAIDQLFGQFNDIKINANQTLQEIADNALESGMGIAMCDKNGITFIEPKRLEQTMNDE